VSIALRSWRTGVVNLGLLLGSCVAGLALCEVSLRLCYPKYRHLAEAQFHLDAMRIWARTPNVRDWNTHADTFVLHSFHHNNLALRQHRNFTEADLASATNIGVFGDSFTENVRLPVQYSFTEPLDYLLNQSGTPFNVLNFGVYGYGLGQSLLHYENFRYVDDLDYVLFVYCENDIRNIHETGLFRLDEAGRLTRHEAIRSAWWVRLISRLHISYLILDASGRLSFEELQKLLSKDPLYEHQRKKDVGGGPWHQEHVEHSLYRGKMDDAEFKSTLAVFQRIVRRWKELVENNGGAFSVVLLPIAPVNPDVATVLLEEDIKVFDLYDCFGAHDPAHTARPWRDSPYRFKSDGHWNEAGNQLAAVCLYRFLEEEMGLPALSEERLGEALGSYYSAVVEGGTPRIPGGGADVASHAAVGIREKYLALDSSDPFSALKDELRTVATQPAKRIIRSVFDVYLDRNQLIYVKEACRSADTRARFFVHVVPVDARDLPEPRRRYGFENRDFSRARLPIGGQRCAARRRLPDYPIRQIRTGQFVKDDEGNYVHLWEGEFVMEHPGGGVEQRAGN